METLFDYVLSGNMTNQNAGYSLWCFAKKNGKEYFVKQFLAPKYPFGDTISSKERINKKTAECDRFEKKKRRIYEIVNQYSDGNDVRIVDFFRVKTKYYIAMEKISALSWEISDIASLSEPDRRRLCAIIAHAVAGLHDGSLVHADLKHENILFTTMPSGTVTAKVIDFDSAFLEDDPPQKKGDISGDWVYFAPEVWGRFNGQDTRLTCKIDIFSLGILFYRYYTGELPGLDPGEIPMSELSERIPVGQAIWRGGIAILKADIPEDIRDLLQQMLECDPDKRPSAREVFQALRPEIVEEAPTEEKPLEAQPEEPQEEEPCGEIEDKPQKRYCSQCGCEVEGQKEMCDSCREKMRAPFFYTPSDL